MVDVGRDDGAATRDLVTHEFGCHHLRDAGAKAVAGQALLALGVAQVLLHPGQLLVLADGNKLHLGRDDAFAGIVHLADVGGRFGAARRALQAGGLGAQGGQRIALARLQAVVERKGLAAAIGFGVAA